MITRIRKLEPKDLQSLIQLCAAHAEFERVTYSEINKCTLLANQLFSDAPVLQCLVLEKDKMLLGYATFMKQYSTWSAAFYVYLDCMYLEEQMRGQGYGVKFINKIAEYALSENCADIQWQTPDFNKSAIRFYNRIGGQSKTKERFNYKVVK